MSATLVPSCGVLLGGSVHSFGGSDIVSENDDFNAGIGMKMAVAHDYRTPGQVLSGPDVTMAERSGTFLLLNWKPSWTWGPAGGSDASVNAGIDAMAKSIKSLGNHKIMLSVYHEPENDVSGGASGCASSAYKGNSGTPAQYRAMWANVENRFNALGVTNVVWSMNYMGFGNWNCMVDDLWPGNSLVDWVLWDPYGRDGGTFSGSVGSFYNSLTAMSDSTHNYLSKPWGLGEFATNAHLESDRKAYYSNMKSTLDSNLFPKLKLLEVWDTFAGPGSDYRVAYTYDDKPSPSELNAFKAVAADPTIASGRVSIGHL
jgi:hypothetical protein